MGQSLAIPRVIPNDWKRLDLIINKIKFHLGSASSPIFADVTLTGLTASALIGTNASKLLESVTIGSSLTYTRPTLNAIQDIRTSASPTWVGLTLSGKVTSGFFASPVDVTATRQYGLELHYSGNNYDVTGIRSRARLKTTDTTATAQGALLQAANEDGINAGVLNGALIEAIGKSDANAATIAVMRGALVNTEWGDYDTITNLKTLHVRTHSRNAAGAGSFGTGYGIYIENEAVGGNGQAYDAGIYFKGTNLSAGNKAFIYGIDFSGGTYGTSQINLIADGSITMAGTQVIKFDDTNYNFFLGSGAFNKDEGQYNIGIGYQAGYNSEGNQNTFIGYKAGLGNATSSSGYDNFAIGAEALSKLTTGYSNVAIGTDALRDTTSGIRNFALGSYALQKNQLNSGNIAIGNFAMGYRTNPGNFSVAIGYESFRVLAHGGNAYNIGIGAYTGYSTTSGEKNLFMGLTGGYLNTTGSGNIFLGFQSGYNQTTNSNLLIIDNQNRGSAATEITDALIYGVFDATAASQTLRINATLTVSQIAAEDSDVDKFLVDSSGVIKYRTGAQVLSDIGAGSAKDIKRYCLMLC